MALGKITFDVVILVNLFKTLFAKVQKKFNPESQKPGEEGCSYLKIDESSCPWVDCFNCSTFLWSLKYPGRCLAVCKCSLQFSLFAIWYHPHNWRCQFFFNHTKKLQWNLKILSKFIFTFSLETSSTMRATPKF